ncbi:hypothetical protein KC726_04430, partial [Candidatus Woesebacteria bacterium]|nr:hypothetical protein [Candidatus Woesebacteria bacterium]
MQAPPTNPILNCPNGAGTATLSWSAPATGNVSDYPLRLVVYENGAPNWIYYIKEPENSGPVTTTSYSFPVTANNIYGGWMHARNTCGNWSTSVGFAQCSTVVVTNTPTLTNSPIPPTQTNTPTVGTNTPTAVPPTATNTPIPPTSTPTPDADTLSCKGLIIGSGSNFRQQTDADPNPPGFVRDYPLTDRSPTNPPGPITNDTYKIVHHVDTVLENLKSRINYDGDYGLSEVDLCFTGDGKSACIGTTVLDYSWYSPAETTLEYYTVPGATSMLYTVGTETYFSYDSILTSLVSQGANPDIVNQNGMTWEVTVKNTQGYQCNGAEGLIGLTTENPPPNGRPCNVSNTCRGKLGKKPNAYNIAGQEDIQVGDVGAYSADYDLPVSKAGITFYYDGTCSDNDVLQTNRTTAGTENFSWTPWRAGSWAAYVRSVKNWNGYTSGECRGASACVSGFNIFTCLNPDTENDTILNITVEDADWYKLSNTAFNRKGNLTNYIPEATDVIDFDGPGSNDDDGSDVLTVGAAGVVTSTGTINLNQTPKQDHISTAGWYTQSYTAQQGIDVQTYISYLMSTKQVNEISDVSEIQSDTVNHASNTITFTSPSDLASKTNFVLIVDGSGSNIVIAD